MEERHRRDKRRKESNLGREIWKAMKLKPTEFDECKAFWEWSVLKRGEYPELRLLFHIRNEGKDKIERIRLNKIGVSPGVPDYFLACPRGDKAGLWLEIKVPGGKVSKEQEKWLRDLTNRGYEVAICWGWGVAAHTVETYLKKLH